MMSNNLLLITLLTFIGLACSSSSSVQSPAPLPQLTEVEQSRLRVVNSVPVKGAQSAKVFVDEVKKTVHNNTSGLLITGNLPNGCVELTSVKQVIQGNYIRLLIEASQPRNSNCTQALEPFTTFVPFTYEKDVRSLKGFAIGEEVIFTPFN